MAAKSGCASAFASGETWGPERKNKGGDARESYGPAR